MITKPLDFKYRLQPFKHQDSEFLKSREMPYYALFWEMGTGKTKPLIDTMMWLFIKCEIDGVLVVSDKGCYLNWYYDEVPKHMAEGFPYHMAYYKSGARKDERLAMERVMTAKDDVLDILCINVESFSGQSGREVAERFLRNHYSMIIIDESTSIKSSKAERTKTVLKLAPLAEYRRIASGTPITQDPLDLFSQCQFLKPGLLGFTSFVAFRNFYAIQQTMTLGNRSFPQIVGYRNLELLTKSIQPFSSRYLKTECVDLPEKVYETEYVEMSPEQTRVYETLKEQALVQFDRGMLTTTSALTTLEKLHQVACGHVVDDDGTIHELENDRVTTLMRLLEIIGGRCLIWAYYRHDMVMIARALRDARVNFVEYHGVIDQDSRSDALRRWHEDPSIQIFLGSQGTGGKSLTLIEADHSIYYSNGFRLEHRLQSEDRNHRIGQTRKVTYIDLVCRKTVDERVLKRLREKKNIADQVLDGFRELIGAL